MTTLIIQTEDANRRRWTVVDIIENLYLHLVRSSGSSSASS
jgi:hypothetical protein